MIAKLKSKRLLSLLLTLCMVFTMLPITVFAEDTTEVAQIGDIKYETLNSAIDAVKENEEIILLANVEMNIGNLQKPVTINGNGFSIDVPQQKNAAGRLNEDDGRLGINDVLTIKNAKVSFANPTNWSVVMGSNGVLNLLENTECSFAKAGIYTAPGAVINVNASKMSLEDMEYTSMMAEAYATLNVMNGSNFIISRPMNINGITGFKINVDDSDFTVKDCARQGLVKCDLILSNGANVLLDNDYTGYNMYGGNVCEVQEGTTLTIQNCGSRALMTQGNTPTTFTVRKGGTFNCQYNGKDFKATDDETLWYANKGAITIGVYGPSSNGKIYLYNNDVLTFEDGANVKIENNYTRGITNFGTAYIGEGTSIRYNGCWAEGESYEDCRVASGGGIYNANKLTIGENVLLYNNHANTAGDDIFIEKNATLKLCDTGIDWKLDGTPDCEHDITGWFVDAKGSRWEAHEEPYCVQPVSVGDISSGEIALKAAHSLTKSVTVTKNWQDNNNQDGIRPNKITVQLIADGKVVDGKTIVLNSSNQWTGSFTELPEYQNGQKIEYTVEEVKVDGYSTVISGSMEKGFVITNSHTPSVPTEPDGDKPNDGTDSPQTGDNSNMALWIALLFTSGVGILGTTLYSKKKKSVR